MYAKNSVAIFLGKSRSILILALMLGMSTSATAVRAQQLDFRVDAATSRMEMVVHTSRVFTLEKDVPRVLVANPDILRVVPISPNQIQVSALKPGVTQVTYARHDHDREGKDETGDE